jgi:hypothetical protein
MRNFITLSLIILCSPANADWRLPDERYVQGYYAVHNVAPDDVLNVREEPRGSSPKLGSLAFNKDIVEIVSTNSASSWGMLRMGEYGLDEHALLASHADNDIWGNRHPHRTSVFFGRTFRDLHIWSRCDD